MEYLQVKKALENRKKGTLISVEYKSIPTLNSQAKASGIKLEKFTKTVARFGVNYSNIKAVKEQRQQDKENGIVRQQKTIWWNWLDNNNIIKEHKENGKKYLTLTTSKIARPQVKYMLNDKEISKEELQAKGIVINSYWNEKEPIQQYDITLDNLLKIKEKRV